VLTEANLVRATVSIIQAGRRAIEGRTKASLTVEDSEPPGRRPFVMHPLLWMFTVIILGMGAVWLSVATGLDLEHESVKWELTKLAMQVSLVGVAGALFTFVADRYRRAEERRLKASDDKKAENRYREAFLKETLKRFTTSYNKTKGARRIVRAQGLTGSPQRAAVRVAAYDKFMGELNDAQLELEAVKRDLKTSKAVFASDEALEAHAEAMEKYLGEIISEYEKKRPGAGANPAAELSLSEVGQFAVFVDPEDKAEFKEYAKPHGKARDAINEELLALASGKKSLGS
jgi:hypothetical protein